MGRIVDVSITFLEQTKWPALPEPVRPPYKVAILRADHPPIHYYRYLYRLIGDPYNWVSRNRLSDEDLLNIIQHPRVYLYILYVGGVPAGMAELDAQHEKTFELKFFGLAPDFVGKQLGRFFLTHVINLAWSMAPDRLRLETCSLDHPSALPLYQKLGFEVFDQRKGQVELMDE